MGGGGSDFGLSQLTALILCDQMGKRKYHAHSCKSTVTGRAHVGILYTANSASCHGHVDW